MKYLAVLGRQPKISMAELEALYDRVKQISGELACFELMGDGTDIGFSVAQRHKLDITTKIVETRFVEDIDRLGGILKLAVELEEKPNEYLAKLPEGKITIGVSDYSKKATRKTALNEALKLKKALTRHDRSVRVVENKNAVLSTATSLHNGLNGKNERKVELIKVDDEWYRVVGVQDIEAYAKRDQARPARDAKIGMLPPKLAQILINLCGPLKPDATILDPFCGTGVVLQEALLMGYKAYGTDINEKMIEYTKKNLRWLESRYNSLSLREDRHAVVEFGAINMFSKNVYPRKLEEDSYLLSIGDAVLFQWRQPIDAVACEGYLGKPFNKIPTEMELKEQKQKCRSIILGFLKNLNRQIKNDAPVTVAIPAWLRENEKYERLDILDEIYDLGYNVSNKTREGLLYCREGQIVARDIIILRKS